MARIELHRAGERTTAIVHASVTPAVKGMFIGWLGLWSLGELAAIRHADPLRILAELRPRAAFLGKAAPFV